MLGSAEGRIKAAEIKAGIAAIILEVMVDGVAESMRM